ncbi:unnamed protein product [Rotaria sp. Silwood2]|nr:unnamed protein product [Rotaria sp. Silwood2]CAF2757457.1 unnamed protein product [Rotaria sp. Silwood2]CAF2985897.1 unnamed protein product [Rotaria sp. Silwood2]CAF3161161.1 unnamed protein product [Rotaria sp. Silwood2]CAF4002150.1 unnamed protein product [Rotaria sp. Silwood2]
MTTITYPDITHKKGVPEKFNPNSYRVISEEVPENDNIPFWYGHSRPPALYTEPNSNQLPAQGSEARNNPHAGRKVDMVYSNATSFNAPFGIVKTDNVKNEESRWWDWSQPAAEPYGPGVKSQDEWTKIKESSYRNAFNSTGETGPYAKKNTRYSANPYHIRTVGIVPITDLKSENLESVNQTLAEKVSFEQQYNSRDATNYPLRGRRHGAFVIEEQKPKVNSPEQFEPTSSAKIERTSSMWDLFHPAENFRGQIPSNPYKYRRPLPEIKRTQDYGQVWQNAPFANDYQVDQRCQPPYAIKQVNID